MKKTSKKDLVSIKVYFKMTDAVQKDIYQQLQELSKSMGVSLSTATGMSLRRGVPLVKGDWHALTSKTK